VHDAAVVMAGGKTAVAVVTEEFTALAHTMAANAGHPGLRVFSLPYPLETRAEREVRALAREVWPQVLEVLGVTVGA